MTLVSLLSEHVVAEVSRDGSDSVSAPAMATVLHPPELPRSVNELGRGVPLHLHEHMFDTDRMLSAAEIESMRRSNAMAPLGQADIDRLLQACTELTAERVAIAAVLADLPQSWASVRAALNALQRLVGRDVRSPGGPVPD